MRVTERRGFVEQRVDVAGHPLDQRDFDKDQRLVRHARMEKGKAAAIRFEPVLEVGPPLDFVHGLVGDQLFQERRRRFPTDPLQFEKADIEPVGEQLAEIVGETPHRHVAVGQRDQLVAAIDKELNPFRQRVELAQQPDPRRRQCGAHLPLGSGALDRRRSGREPGACPIDRGVIDIEFLGEHMEETRSPGLV